MLKSFERTRFVLVVFQLTCWRQITKKKYTYMYIVFISRDRAEVKGPTIPTKGAVRTRHWKG